MRYYFMGFRQIFFPALVNVLAAALLLSASSFNPLRAQVPFFEKTYGRQGADVCFSVRQLPDSSLYMFGYTENGFVGGYDFSLKKLLPDGTECWSKDYGTAGLDFGLFMNRADDYNLILIGTTQNPVTVLGEDVLLIKVDSAGNELWRQVIGGNGNESCRYVEQTADGGFIFCGITPDPGNSNDAWVGKTDAFGNLVWSNNFGGTGNDVASRVVATTSHSWAMSCDTRLGGNGSYDVMLIGLDSAGNQSYSYIRADSLTNGTQGMICTTTGRLVTFGETEVFPGSPFDFLVNVFDAQGNPLRDVVFGGPGAEAMFDMTETSAGDYIGVGYTNSSGGAINPIDLGVVRMDTLGNLLWFRQFGSSSIDIGYSVIPAIGGGYYVAGRTTLADEEFYLLHIDENGLTGFPENTEADKVLNVYPNPAKSGCNVQASQEIAFLEILDAAGREILNIENGNSANMYLDISYLNPGYYFLKVIYPGGAAGFARLTVQE